ncbi:hypothetical protein DESUT3_30850 [Desulfuromonas versatilis]|uniref:histidine kinase n=1 Tax=Desulfuromonas versatilis TaxID=2802975 RepID=A0ABM8HUK5_9BACT|nr:HAMP domain-containing sensor histidine kinase [Desulfuromonas versatilis]BCR06016.1 hypothetical protein DESUT3_30850 [Desulfuromonas versatilis]
MIHQVIKKLEGTKHRIIASTFVLLLGLFVLFALFDLKNRFSDYKYFSLEINNHVEKAYNSELIYLNTRIINYLNRVIKENNLAEMTIRRDLDGIKTLIDPLLRDFGNRYVPVFFISVVDINNKEIYQAVDGSFEYMNALPSPATKEALDKNKPTHGFEFHGLPFHYNISIPIVTENDKKICGAVELALNPSWFDFKLRWFLEEIRVAIYTVDQQPVEDFGFNRDRFYPLPPDYGNKRATDKAFFQSIIKDIDVQKKSIEVKGKSGHYMISSFPLLGHDQKEVGRLLVASSMSKLRDRQWDYFSIWILCFICTIGLMLIISLIGFRKYEKIIVDQEKKIAHHSKRCAQAEMLSYIGHQWRQPLNTLSMAIQNLELQNQLGKLNKDLFEKQIILANKNVDYLTHVIEDWRALLTAGATRQPIDLAKSVNRAIDIVRPTLDHSRILIENRIEGSYKTKGFANDIVQITVNVLLNAKDALAGHDGNRIIMLSSSEENGLVTVRFQDSGGGMPPTLLQRVFEAYLTTKDDSVGTGLGLYLCRQLAENLENGKVWAENQEFGFDGQRYYGACIYLQFRAINEGVSP